MKELFDNFEVLLEAPNGIKMLREMILQLAVMGKLVKQDPKDEPASILLEKIKKEKEQLIKEGKLKAEKPLPPIKEEDKPYKLPKGWEWARLSQVISFDKYAIKRGPFGSSVKKIFFVPSGYKVYEQKNAIYNNFSLGKYYINEKKFEELKAFEVKPKDIIISCSGTVGKLAIVPDNIEPGIINQALLKIKLNEIILLNKYFMIMFPAFFMTTDELNDLKGTAQKNITSVNVLNSISFPLPPIAEQERIVARVEELMGLCNELEQQKSEREKIRVNMNNAALNRLLNATNQEEFQKHWNVITSNFNTLYNKPENMEKLKQAILQLAVMGKLVKQDPKDEPASVLLEKIKKEKEQLIKEGKLKAAPPLLPIKEDEKPYTLPKGWEWVRLNYYYDVRDGTHDTPKYFSTGIPFITSKNISSGKLDLNNVQYISIEDHLKIKKRSGVERDDIILAVIGSIGNPIIVDTDEEFSIKNVALIKYYNRYLSNPFYLKYYLQVATESMKMKSSGAVQSFISLNFLRNYLFPLAPLSEQERIVSKINELISMCDGMHKKLIEAENLRETLFKSVLNRLFLKDQKPNLR